MIERLRAGESRGQGFWRWLWRQTVPRQQVVLTWYEAVERGQVRQASDLFAEDFECRGLTPEPLDRERVLALYERLRRAFPDWRFHAHAVAVHGEAVTAGTAVTGTQTGPLEAPEAGVTRLEPTGRSIALPEEYPVFIVRHGKICALYTVLPPGGGLSGILRQLGVSATAVAA